LFSFDTDIEAWFRENVPCFVTLKRIYYINNDLSVKNDKVILAFGVPNYFYYFSHKYGHGYG